jgi:hypothetical protein
MPNAALREASFVQRPGFCLTTLLALTLFAGCSGPALSAIYYVDYEHGSDARVGTTPDAAWKHVPGDKAATGNAATTILRPGDTVRFRGGVAYRGSFTVSSSGAPGRPIVFAGDEWGTKPAIFEGADPAQTLEPCPSASACAGAKNWKDLTLVSYAPPPTGLIKFFDTNGALFESQYPAPKNPFFADDVTEYLPTPAAEATRIEQGEIHSRPLASSLEENYGDASLSIWTYGNQVTRRPISSISDDVVRFPPQGLRLYKDRPGRIAVVNAAALIADRGQYAVIAPGRAVAWLRAKDTYLQVGNGRRAIDLGGKSDVTIRGFIFQHYTSSKYGEGVQITNSGSVSERISIEKNTFQHSSLYSGAGAIMIGRVNHADIKENTFKYIERGSGIRTNLKPVTNLSITGNRFENIGKTGILVMGSHDVQITNNVLSDLYGIHGNGISVYMDNRNVHVVGNKVINASRPMTFHGEEPGSSPGDHNISIRDNMFLTKSLGSGALISYGKMRGVLIENNVLIAPKNGLILSAKDQNVTVRNNATTGIATKGETPSGWTIDGNSSVSKKQLQSAQMLTP